MRIQKYSAYLLLGANLGNCKDTLRKARLQIEKRVGTVLNASKVYNSKAWGFESLDIFYNQALLIETSLAPFATMQALLSIENDLGRDRNSESDSSDSNSNSESANPTYLSRIIDIDILFFENYIIKSPLLTVPHPRVHLRRFALVPMSEIAPNLVHPEMNKTITQLLEECLDEGDVTAPVLPAIDSPNLSFLAIEGNIGSGKTALSTRIAHDYGAKLITETFEENVFLPKFYESKERYAFPLELTFLAERYRQAKDEFVSDLFCPFIVSDFVISKSLVFAQKTLPIDEYNLFSKLFRIILSSTPKPDLYVYLHSNTSRLKQNIIKRGRDYELNMSEEYLQMIEDGYMDYIKTLPPEKVLIIPCQELDFVGKEEDYRHVMDLIANKISENSQQ